MPDKLKKFDIFGIGDKPKYTGFYPESCSGLCEGNSRTEFIIKTNEVCPTEYFGNAPPVKIMMTPKHMCKTKVIVWNWT